MIPCFDGSQAWSSLYDFGVDQFVIQVSQSIVDDGTTLDPEFDDEV